MDFLPQLEPVENLQTNNVKEEETKDNIEIQIKELNEPPLEDIPPEEESPFEEKKTKPKSKRKPKPKQKTKAKPAKQMMIYEEEEEEEVEEELPEREQEIVIDPKREKRLENLKKAREARKAKAEYKKRTPKLKPALQPEPSIRETFNTHLLPTEEEKTKMLMEREHMQFMSFMNNMEKYKSMKKGFQQAMMEDEAKSKPKPTPTPAPRQAPAPAPAPKPTIIQNKEPFNEYSKYFG